MNSVKRSFQRSHRFFGVTGALTSVAILVLLAPAAMAVQQGAANSAPARTAWGDPDLQGVYTFATQTPVERPKELGGKAVYTDEELAKLAERAEAARAARAARAPDPARPSGGYDAV